MLTRLFAPGVTRSGSCSIQPSTRYVSVEQAKSIISTLPPFVTMVGVFVDVDPARRAGSPIRRVALLHFHGDESDAACAAAGFPTSRPLVCQSRSCIRSRAALSERLGLLARRGNGDATGRHRRHVRLVVVAIGVAETVDPRRRTDRNKRRGGDPAYTTVRGRCQHRCRRSVERREGRNEDSSSS